MTESSLVNRAQKNFLSTLTGTPSLTPEKLQIMSDWHDMAISRFETLSTYHELHSFYEGYFTSLEDVMKLLHKDLVKETVKKAKKTGRFSIPLTIIALAGGYILVQQKNAKDQNR